MSIGHRILYCNCTYAQVVPKETKEAVLRQLTESGVNFEAVADLCELSAQKDPSLKRLSADGPVKIAACFPRAVKWLFTAASAPLPLETTEIVNMRTLNAEQAKAQLLQAPLQPNLPTGKETAPSPATEAVGS
jgi:hypothetical protein